MNASTDMRPIETTYAGYKFRSRLEARWAVFFETLGLNWRYEPEGFVLPSGLHYLPDFQIILRRGPLWVEVKPRGGDISNFEEFMRVVKGIGTVLRDIPNPLHVQLNNDWYKNLDEPHIWIGPNDGWDNYHTFCVCNACGEVGFEFDGRSARIGCGCDIHKDSDRNHTTGHPRILEALAAARSARFEHDHREDWRVR